MSSPPTSPPAFPILEKDRRKPDFLPDSVPIELADGQEWYFARPRVRYRIADNELGFEQVTKLGTGFDATYQGLLDAWDKAVEELQANESNTNAAAAWAKIQGAQFKVARYLLERNYTLTTAEIGDLIEFAYTPNEPDPMREDILGVARGATVNSRGEPFSPKPSTAGDPFR